MPLCAFCEERTKNERHGAAPRVAVLGAGIAGMSVAHELAERGFAIDVFEAGDRVGGLAATQPFSSERIFGPTPPGEDAPVLPSEHGFRAFYSFYRHLTDTMQRIPMVERGEHAAGRSRDQPRSVADNLRPTYKVALARADSFRELQYDRRTPRSMAAVVYTLGVWMLGMGYQSKDLARVVTKLLQFLTSCTARRYKELTKQSLWDFLQVADLSPHFLREFKDTSRFLVALDPESGDAMTQALALTRLLMDPVIQNEAGITNVDRVLNGPTSERWFDPWKTFLEEGHRRSHQREAAATADGKTETKTKTKTETETETKTGTKPKAATEATTAAGKSHRGVRFFFRQALEGFEYNPRKHEISGATLICRQPGCSTKGPYTLASRREGAGDDNAGYDYFVSAVPGNVLWDKIKDDEKLLAADRAETKAYLDDAPADEDVTHGNENPHPRDWLDTVGDPPLEELASLVVKKTDTANYHPWMSGVQFYLSDRMAVLPGHIHFPGSPWALTAVCQSQFWGGDFAARYGHGRVRSIISVDICEFDTKGNLIKKTVKDCTSDEIAAEVWSQMAAGLQGWDMLLPTPHDRAGSDEAFLDGDQRAQDDDIIENQRRVLALRRAMLGARQKLSGPEPPIPAPYLDHHVDDGVRFERGNRYDGKMMADETASGVTYFVPGVDSWKSRPGPLPSMTNWDRGYRVRLRRLVVVGHFAQTFTSINTMEAANESARHGVNGLLVDVERKADAAAVEHGKKQSRVRYERCTVWPLEADEPSALMFLKEIDEHLFTQKKKHVFDLLAVDRWIAQLFPQGDDIDNSLFDDDAPLKKRLADSDHWKSFERRFSLVWEQMMALGRFSSFFG